MAAAKKPLIREQIEDKLVIWMQRLDLLHWDIRLVFETIPPASDDDEPVLARIDAQDRLYDKAVLTLDSSVLERAPDAWGTSWSYSADHVLAHELVHCVLRDVDRAAFRKFDATAPSAPAYAAVDADYHEMRERAVDHLAIALVNGWGPA